MYIERYVYVYVYLYISVCIYNTSKASGVPTPPTAWAEIRGANVSKYLHGGSWNLETTSNWGYNPTYT